MSEVKKELPRSIGEIKKTKSTGKDGRPFSETAAEMTVPRSEQLKDRSLTKIIASKPISPENHSFTIAEIAEKFRMTHSGATCLIKNGAFPNAFLQMKGKTRRWRVPAGDLANFFPGKKGKVRLAVPNAAAIEARGAYARKKIKAAHGTAAIAEIIRLGGEGGTAAEIAAQFRLEENRIADLLEQMAARRAARLNKKSPLVKELRPKRALKSLPPKKRLIELYVKSSLPQQDILKELKINSFTFYSALRHYGIPLRNAGSNQASQEREQRLKQLFFVEKLAFEEIADRMNLTVHHIQKTIGMLKRRKTRRLK